LALLLNSLKCVLWITRRDEKDVVDVYNSLTPFVQHVAPPIHALEELERMRKEAQEWLDKVGKLIEQRKDISYNGNIIQFKSQIEESMSVAGTIVEYIPPKSNLQPELSKGYYQKELDISRVLSMNSNLYLDSCPKKGNDRIQHCQNRL
jgi:hypothetical protein